MFSIVEARIRRQIASQCGLVCLSAFHNCFFAILLSEVSRSLCQVHQTYSSLSPFSKENFWPLTDASYIRPPFAIVKIAIPL